MGVIAEMKPGKKLAACLSGLLIAGMMLSGHVAFAEEMKDLNPISYYGEVKADRAYQFELVVKSFQASYWQAVRLGMEEAAKELGVSINVVGPGSESNIAEQMTMLQMAVDAKPDGIGMAVVDNQAVGSILANAQSSGIPVIAYDSDVTNAPEGSVLCLVATDNYAAGELAAEKLYPMLKDRIAGAASPVRIGEINQDRLGKSIEQRGLGFLDRIASLAEEDGYKCAVVGDDWYRDRVKAPGDEKEADILLEVAVPAQTSIELAANCALGILKKNDTIAIFGSNQVVAEAILQANASVKVIGTGEDQILGAAFDAGYAVKAAVRNGVFVGSVAQSPELIGKLTVQALTAAANGEELTDIRIPGFWFDLSNIDDEEMAVNLYD